MDRREFLGRLAATGAAALAVTAAGVKLWNPRHIVPGFEPVQGHRLPSFAVGGEPGRPTLAIAHGAQADRVVRAALGELGGMERFIRKGDVVLLKPNVAFDRPPALGATTHPETLAAVARLVREAGASRILVADNPINSPAGCFLKSGIGRVADELGLEIMLPESAAFAPIDVDGEILRQWPMFYEPVRRADKVIGIAPCKDHNLCHASMAMKNWYGLLGGRRNQFHQDIHTIVADFALMMQPTLVVLDGMRVLMSNGPTGGRLSDVKEVGAVIAGTDMVAVDACGFELLLGRDPAQLEYVNRAHARGLGNMSWREGHWKEVRT
jgi:uncharacterized protein (DUF362 family)